MNCCDNCRFVASFDEAPEALFCNCYESPNYDDLMNPYDCCYMYTKDFLNSSEQEQHEHC